MVGRTAELAELESALTDLQGGHGSFVLVGGEAGIGKSRLTRELVAAARRRGLDVVEGRATPPSTGWAYRPLTEALLQLVRHRDVEVDESIGRWLPALSGIVPGLVPGATPGVVAGGAAGPASAADPIDGVAAAVRGEAVLRLVRRVASAGVVVVLEDLHWSDRDTLAVLEYLADNAGAEALLWVVTLRTDTPSAASELARRLRGRARVRSLALERLDPAETAQMISACAPDRRPEHAAWVQRTAEGVPLLVEELLASPGLPDSITETVRARLAVLPASSRTVIDCAAVLGHRFDWTLLSAATGEPERAVAVALAEAVECQLLTTDGIRFWFRHALIREAVLGVLLPPRQRAVAAAALRALDAANPEPDVELCDVAADLALRAGERRRAGLLLEQAGERSLEVGALATAVESLQRAAELLQDGDERVRVELSVLDALALAGRVDEAAAVGGRLTRLLGPLGDAARTRAEVHLRLAQAAVASTRWPMARYQLDAARTLVGRCGDPVLPPRVDVLSAEVALAEDDLGLAARLAHAALAADPPPALRCHALEIVGRSRRLHDRPAARRAFAEALATAEAAALPLWRLRALHELGTVDMFDHLGIERLVEAHALAGRMGLPSTLASLDLQLSACHTARWDLDACDRQAGAAIDAAQRFDLPQVRAKALAMLTGSASMRGDLAATEHYMALAIAAAPDDAWQRGFCWASRGMALLTSGDEASAVAAFARGMRILSAVPHGEPASVRALWPLLLAGRRDRRAEDAVAEARRLGVAAFALNRGLIGYAEAVLRGQAGQRARAEELLVEADLAFVNCAVWADLARLLAAPAAIADGWGDPEAWLVRGVATFAGLGLVPLSRRCEQVLASVRGNPWAARGVTDREAEVLSLLVRGWSNRQIATQLHLSVRTVEKHVENLMRKTGVRSRTELAVTAAT